MDGMGWDGTDLRDLDAMLWGAVLAYETSTVPWALGDKDASLLSGHPKGRSQGRPVAMNTCSLFSALSSVRSFGFELPAVLWVNGQPPQNRAGNKQGWVSKGCSPQKVEFLDQESNPSLHQSGGRTDFPCPYQGKGPLMTTHQNDTD